MKKAPVKKTKKVVKEIKPKAVKAEVVLPKEEEVKAPAFVSSDSREAKAPALNLGAVRKEKTSGPLPYLYAIGKRKTAAARIRLYPKDSRGLIMVNDKDYKVYFPYFEYQNEIEQPLKKAGLLGKYFISVKVIGGGLRGQSQAIRHGLARVLLKINETYRKALRSEGWLTRDPRKKERKKPGLKRARRAPQWQKR